MDNLATADTDSIVLRVRGNSMEPRFPAGSWIYATPDLKAEDDDFVIVKRGDAMVFGQLANNARTLRFLDTVYPPINLRPDDKVRGVVCRVELEA
jgi:phage repressor protein C with HTH and peptisase S24 domain